MFAKNVASLGPADRVERLRMSFLFLIRIPYWKKKTNIPAQMLKNGSD